jgi:hypothetical protein
MDDGKAGFEVNLSVSVPCRTRSNRGASSSFGKWNAGELCRISTKCGWSWGALTALCLDLGFSADHTDAHTVSTGVIQCLCNMIFSAKLPFPWKAADHSQHRSAASTVREGLLNNEISGIRYPHLPWSRSGKACARII